MDNTVPNHSIGNLLIQICKVRRNKSNALLSKVDIHSGQDALLYYLNLEDGQTVSSLAEKLCIQQGTIASMLDRMSASGMVKKEKDLSDRRTSRVFLTDNGKEAFKTIVMVWNEMENATVAGLSDEQQDQLRELLKKVLMNLR